MKLLTAAQIKYIPRPYSQENEPNPIFHVKLFTPWTNWEWYIIEYDPETRVCFGWVIGFESEMGYFDLNELEEIKHSSGLKIERDLWFEPKKLSEIKKGE